VQEKVHFPISKIQIFKSRSTDIKIQNHQAQEVAKFHAKHFNKCLFHCSTLETFLFAQFSNRFQTSIDFGRTRQVVHPKPISSNLTSYFTNHWNYYLNIYFLNNTKYICLFQFMLYSKIKFEIHINNDELLKIILEHMR